MLDRRSVDWIVYLVQDAVQVLVVYELHVKNRDARVAALIVTILVVHANLIARDSYQAVPIVAVLLALHDTTADQQVISGRFAINYWVIEQLLFKLVNNVLMVILIGFRTRCF